MLAKAIICTLVALSTAVAGPAFAQNDKDILVEKARQQELRNRAGHAPSGGAANPGDNRRRAAPPPPRVQQQRARANDAPRYDPQRHREVRLRHDGPGWYDGRRHWNRGDRLPSQYRERRYVVDDWRGRRLSAPPRGYHWIQADGSFLLVAITTGVIASILLSR